MNKFYKTVKGWSVTKAERAWLYDAAKIIEKQFPEPVIVNIGVLFGATMHCLRAGASSARLFGVDIKLYPLRREKELNATIIKGNSNTCHTKFQDKIHFLFIDGDHRYKGVKADIVGWSPKVAVGGMIAFHDYESTLPHVVGVKKAVNEWKALERKHWKQLQTVDSVCTFKRIS